ncbi:MAG: pyridoxal phosphate-dependent aminotransferase, partial [Solibacillus isronensis]
RLLSVGQVALDPGTKYGEAGRGFLRINVACPFELLQDGVERIKRTMATFE